MPRATLTADQRLLRGVNRRSLSMVDTALADGGDPNRTVVVEEQGHSPTAGPRARRSSSSVPTPPAVAGGASSPWTGSPRRLDDRCGALEIVPLLVWAIRKATPAIVERLIQAGAAVSTRNPATGRTPLHEAAHRGQVRAVKALLAAGADVNVEDHLGETAFFWRHPKVRTVLIAAGLDLNLPGLNGHRPLHEAAERGDAHQVRWCLRHGARADVVDDDGQTPLHRAVARSDTATLTALLLAGADPYALDRDGRTPLDGLNMVDAEVAQRFQSVLVAHERQTLRQTMATIVTTAAPSRRRL